MEKGGDTYVIGRTICRAGLLGNKRAWRLKIGSVRCYVYLHVHFWKITIMLVEKRYNELVS